LLDLAFQEAAPQPLWQNVPHLGEDWGNVLLHFATDNDGVVGDIDHGAMPAYFGAFDFPHKDNFLSYLHNFLLYFGRTISSLLGEQPDPVDFLRNALSFISLEAGRS
jgi:hypothetical protein